MQRDATDFLKRIRDLGFPVKVDTNGFFPAVLRRLLEEGLCDYIAMDIKNSPDKYGETVGVPGVDLSSVQESVQVLISCKIPYEFRTTAGAGIPHGGGFSCHRKVAEGGAAVRDSELCRLRKSDFRRAPRLFRRRTADVSESGRGESGGRLHPWDLENGQYIAMEEEFITQHLVFPPLTFCGNLLQ